MDNTSTLHPLQTTWDVSSVAVTVIPTRELDDGPQTNMLTHAKCSNNFNYMLNTLFTGTICILGFLGNSVSYIVMSKDKTTPVASFLLKTLALTDNLFLCAWFLHFSLADAFSYFQVDANFHITWLYIRVYTYPLLFVGQSGTIWLTVLIAVTRYIAVCQPYRAVKYCALPLVRKSVVVILCSSLIYNVPRFFETKFVTVDTQNTSRYILTHTALGKDKMYQLVYFDILYYIFSFVVPLLLLLFFNTRLTLAYRLVQHRRRLIRSRCDIHDHNNITLVMIVIILLFIVCNAPARLVQLIWRYQEHKCLTARFVVNKLSNVLEVFNSSVNFLIYCVCRKKFRHILNKTICNISSTNIAEEETTKYNLNGISTKSKITEC